MWARASKNQLALAQPSPWTVYYPPAMIHISLHSMQPLVFLAPSYPQMISCRPSPMNMTIEILANPQNVRKMLPFMGMILVEKGRKL
jgi:hypothetical protein